MATIKEDYVSFETAKLLKEKGFDGDTASCYILEDRTHHIMSDKVVQSEYYESQDSNEHGHLIQAPTHQMAMKWLREVHDIHIVTVFLGHSLKWTPTIWKIDMVIPESKHVKSTFNTWETYEEACEVAIKYCLENLI